jgi:hypothetical protein
MSAPIAPVAWLAKATTIVPEDQFQVIAKNAMQDSSAKVAPLHARIVLLESSQIKQEVPHVQIVHQALELHYF